MTFNSLTTNRTVTLLVCMLLTGGATQAQVTTVSGNIADISNGWGQEGYYVTLKNASGTSGCANSMGYIALPSRSDQKYMVANAMLAMFTGAIVHIAFQGCYNGSVGSIVGLKVLAN